MQLPRLVAIALVVTACGGAGQATPPASPGATFSIPPRATPVGQTPPPASASPVVTGTPTDPVAAYGYGPQPDPTIVYQPVVVVIGGGPAAIRGVSADGLTWSLDARAAGVDQIAAGKVMFATSDALGRVVRSEPNGDVVNVTVAPVTVGEVIRDGHLVIDQALPLDSLSIYEAPQIANGYEDIPSDELTATPSPAADAGSVALSPPTLGLLAGAGPGGGTEIGGTQPSAVSEASTKVGDWTLTAYRTDAALGLRAERGLIHTQDNLKVALDAHVEVADLRVVADIPVTSGQVGSSHFRVFGIKGLKISIQAGAVNGLSDNRKVRFEIPVALSQRVIIGGFPATLTQKFKFLVQTAFTAKNGNLTASGEWNVNGSIGIDGQTLTLPTLTSRGTKLIDSLMGVSVGVNGIVVAVSFEFGLLFGLPLAGAGPVAAFITSLGLTNGSSLGIVQCQQVSITSVLTAGVGLQIFDPIKKALKTLLNYDPPAQTTLVTQNILQENWVKPDVVACR
jgi:hypothetical protein